MLIISIGEIEPSTMLTLYGTINRSKKCDELKSWILNDEQLPKVIFIPFIEILTLF